VRVKSTAHSLVAASLALSLVAFSTRSHAGPTADTERRVKAALLYNLAKYIRWPAADRRSKGVTLCVLGVDTLGPALDRFQGRKVRGRVLQIVRLKRLGQRRCHVLFISPSEDGRLDEVLRKLGTSATLTVGETRRFARRGGVIGFRKEKQRITLVCNVNAAKRARLRISSRLLRLMKLVRP
jgi:hypothetical protein